MQNEDTIKTLEQCKEIAEKVFGDEQAVAIVTTKLFEMWCQGNIALYGEGD